MFAIPLGGVIAGMAATRFNFLFRIAVKIELNQIRKTNTLKTMDECSICYDPIVTTETGYMKLPCDHVYHFKCISMWFKHLEEHDSTCPLCRRNMSHLMTLPTSIVSVAPPSSINPVPYVDHNPMIRFTRLGINTFLIENGGSGLSRAARDVLFNSYLSGGIRNAFICLAYNELNILLMGNGARNLTNDAWDNALETYDKVEINPEIAMQELISRLYDTDQMDEGDAILYIMLYLKRQMSEEHFWIFENALAYVKDYTPDLTNAYILPLTIKRLNELADQLAIADLAPIRPPYREVAVKSQLIWLEYYAITGPIVSEDVDAFLGIPKPLSQPDLVLG